MTHTERRQPHHGPRAAFHRLDVSPEHAAALTAEGIRDYDAFDDELRPDDARMEHERGRLHNIRLTDDEMDQAMRIHHEIHELVDHAAHIQQIGEYLAARLNRVHVEQSGLLHRIKERECIRVLDIALDQDFKIVEARQ